MEDRTSIDPMDNVGDVLMKMAEGNPGAITVMMNIMKIAGQDGVFYLLHLDDMNIRGTQIWIGYKDYCGEDINKFIECIKGRDKKMVDCINKQGRMGNHEYMAVQHGGSNPGGRLLLGNNKSIL